MLSTYLRRGFVLWLLLWTALMVCGQTSPPVTTYPVSYWNPALYAPDIFYRFSPSTGAMAAGATATYTNANEYAAPSNALGWNQGAGWEFTDNTKNDPSMNATMVVNMGRTFCVAELDMYWALNMSPQNYELLGSTDGVNYTPLVTQTPLNTANGMIYNDFAPTTIQYIKLVCTGSSPTNTFMELVQFKAYASTSGPPLTDLDNLNAVEISSPSVNALTSNWANSPAAWEVVGYSYGNGYTAQTPEAQSGQNAQFLIDLGQVFSTFTLSFLMYNGSATWQYGGMVEVSPDNKKWTTVLNQTPLVSTNINLTNVPGGPSGYFNLRYIRFTDNASGTDLGDATLGCVVPYLYSNGAAPTTLATVTVPTGASTMSAAVYDRNGQQLRQLLLATPVQGGQPFNITWDGKDGFGNVLPNDVYEWRTAYSTVTGTMDEPGSSNGFIGNSGLPPWGTTNRNGIIQDCDCDSERKFL